MHQYLYIYTVRLWMFVIGKDSHEPQLLRG